MGVSPVTNGLKSPTTVASPVPLMASPNVSLSQRYGPAIIFQGLGAENGLFHPILTLAQKV